MDDRITQELREIENKILVLRRNLKFLRPKSLMQQQATKTTSILMQLRKLRNSRRLLVKPRLHKKFRKVLPFDRQNDETNSSEADESTPSETSLAAAEEEITE